MSNTIVDGDDIAVITDNINHMQPELDKLQQFAEWVSMNLNLNKCALVWIQT